MKLAPTHSNDSFAFVAACQDAGNGLPTAATVAAVSLTSASADANEYDSLPYRPLFERVWRDGLLADVEVLLADGRTRPLWSALLQHASPFFERAVADALTIKTAATTAPASNAEEDTKGANATRAFEACRPRIDCTHWDAWSVETLLRHQFVGSGVVRCPRHRSRLWHCRPSLPAYVRLCRVSAALGLAVPPGVRPLFWRDDGAFRVVAGHTQIAASMHHGGRYRLFNSLAPRAADDSCGITWSASPELVGQVNSFLGVRHLVDTMTFSLLDPASRRLCVRLNKAPRSESATDISSAITALMHRVFACAASDSPSFAPLYQRITREGFLADTRLIALSSTAAKPSLMQSRPLSMGVRLPSFLLRLLSSQVAARLIAFDSGGDDSDRASSHDRYVLDCGDLPIGSTTLALTHALGDGRRGHARGSRCGGEPCVYCHGTTVLADYGAARHAANVLHLSRPLALVLSCERSGALPPVQQGDSAPHDESIDVADPGQRIRIASASVGISSRDANAARHKLANTTSKHARQRHVGSKHARQGHGGNKRVRRIPRITLDPVVGLLMFAGGDAGPHDACKLEACIGDDPADMPGAALAVHVDFRADAGALALANAWLGRGARLKSIVVGVDWAASSSSSTSLVVHVAVDGIRTTLDLSEDAVSRWGSIAIDLSLILAAASESW